MQLYDKIFRVVSENMLSSGLEFNYSQSAFNSIIGKAPQQISAIEFQNMSGADLLVSVYLRCLNRLPDDGAWKNLKELTEKYQNDSVTQYFILLQVTKSTEFKKYNKKILEMKALRKALPKEMRFVAYCKTRTIGIISEVRFILHKYIFEPIWKRLPNNVKNFIRVLLGRERK